MAMTDPISACLTTIRNALKNKQRDIKLPGSRIKGEICRVLKEEGFINAFSFEKEDGKSFLNVTLRYTGGGKSVITELKRISKPGCRIYKDKDGIPVYRNGLGLYIVSTPKGIMTDRSARKESVGGELLCSVW